MTTSLEQQAKSLLSAAPVSVQLPAGTGKTHLLAAAVNEAAKQGHRSLILTHTNAGVDAIRKRLSQFGVPPKLYRVDTIAGWAFKLAKSYQVIAGIRIPDTPDWTQSGQYMEGAIKVASSSSIKEVIRLSYDYLLVDEYQDCVKDQHHFILTLHESIPRTIVFGDPLQGIFGFKDNALVSWDEDVVGVFPPHHVELIPYRWLSTNPSLGKLTLDIRPKLFDGNIIDLSGHENEGVLYLSGDPDKNLQTACYSLTNRNESVVVLTDWPAHEDHIAKMLRGGFNIIEPISGKRMIKSLKELPEEGDPRIAHWFAETAKKFHVGISRIDAPLLEKLYSGESVAGLSRKGLQELIDALAYLQQNPSYQALLFVESVPGNIENVRCPYKEAWRDIFRAIKYGIEEGSSDMVENLSVIRSKYKHMERRLPSLIVSRTLIVKGLEFDHVVISDLKKFSDPRHLYVALSRAKKSVTVLGLKPKVRLKTAK